MEIITEKDLLKNEGQEKEKGSEDKKPFMPQFKLENAWGVGFGVALIWAIGLSGFIFYCLGIAFGIWFASRIFQSQKGKVRVIFFILLLILIVSGPFLRNYLLR